VDVLLVSSQAALMRRGRYDMNAVSSPGASIVQVEQESGRSCRETSIVLQQ